MSCCILYVVSSLGSYRVIPSPDKNGQSSSQQHTASASLPTTPPSVATSFRLPSANTRKQLLTAGTTSSSSSSSGGRRRGGSGSSKILSSAPSGNSFPVRVTRSLSGHAPCPPDPPPRVTRSQTATLPLLPAPVRRSVRLASVGSFEVPKEKSTSGEYVSN